MIDKTKEYEHYTSSIDYTHTNFRAADITTVHGIVGLVSEVGELADLLKKAMYKNSDMSRDDLIDETGDILYYATMILRSVGSTLNEAMDRNTTKLKYRMANGKNKDAERVLQLASNG